MKAKRIDSARLKQLFAAHVEKISFAIFSLVFVWLCYSAYQTRRYDKTPKDLADQAQLTATTVENQPWNPVDWQIQIPNPPYVKQVEVVMQKVAPTPFALATLFDPPIRENKVRRDEPKYLAVRELRTSFGFGAVKPKKDAPLGRQWVVITGLLPVAEQEAEYQKLFSNAWYTNPDLDTPQWLDFQVERTEVDSPAGGNEQWTAIDVHAAIIKEFGQFAAPERPEVVDKKFQLRSVNDPVPPLIGREPDESMAHPPEIPYALQVKDKDNQQKQPEQTVDTSQNPLAVSSDQQRPAVMANNQGQQTQVETTPFRLFRFFDYSVENDRMYRYRIKVVLKNPNLKVAKRYLARPELAEGDRRESPWSDASPVVIVPPNSRVLAGDVTPPRGFNESKAKVLVIKWEEPKAVEVPHEFVAQRGAFMNYPDEEAEIPIPGAPDKTSPGKISFETNTMLVDIIGGEQVQGPNERKIHAPSMMLFMDPFGQMVIHAHVEDYVEFTARRPAAPVKEKKKKDEDADTDIGPGAGPRKKGTSLFDIPTPK